MSPGPDADTALLVHIRDCIERIAEYAGGDRRRFDSSRLVQDAIVRNLQTPAESSQRLSDAIKATEPQIAWHDLSGFRNIVVHGYLRLDLSIVWAIVERELAALYAAAERMAERTAPKP